MLYRMNLNHTSKLAGWQTQLYSIENYVLANKEFINNNKIEFNDITKICEELNNNKYYHFRIHKKSEYIFFGDLDNYKKGINNFIELLIDFLKTTYNLELKKEDISYTKNNTKKGSYHYSIPKWNLSCENLKELHSKFLKINKKEFIYKNETNIISCIDTTIYSEHWFRCPNQSKGTNDNGIHIIKNGEMKDFIIDYIPEQSININNIIESIHVKKLLKDKKIIEKINIVNNMTSQELDSINNTSINNNTDITPINNNELVLTSTLSQPQLYKKLFDDCYAQYRFDTYEYWKNVGMSLKNIFGDNDIGIELFNYYSLKGNNYEGYEITVHKYKTFEKKIKGHSVGTIYFYAIEDNKPKFIEIIGKNELELTPTDFSKYVKILAGNRFIYIKTYLIDSDVTYKLYCLNSLGYWNQDDTLFKKFIGNELYNFLKLILVEVYWNSREFNQLKAKLERLKYMTIKKDIIETYKEDGTVDNIEMDNKWWLLGFTNIVYDLEKYEFRKYKYDDYITTTTGYDWRDPTDEELTTVNNLINNIFPNVEERNLYLQILATGLDGRCLEKFIIANGGGRNGKGMLNDLFLHALGNYGLLGNNSILFETPKTGSNPEKAIIHKKRLVIFREPPAKNKFQNAIVKELTGGGTFSSRTHQEKNPEKQLNLTMIVECNNRPLLAEEPTNADIGRIIDIEFKSTFTTDKSLIDNKYYFEANLLYKTKKWQQQHKYALIKILIDYHKIYTYNNCVFNIPSSIDDRTKNYLQMSCDIITWFKDNYIITNNDHDILKIKDIYIQFTKSHHFLHMSCADKKKYNKTYFVNYIQTNKFFHKYYCDRFNNIRTLIKYWKKKDNDESDDDNTSDN